MNFTDLNFFYSDILIFFDKCLITLSVKQSGSCTLSSQPVCWLWDTLTHNAFEIKHFPWNAQFVSFDRPNHLYLLKVCVLYFLSNFYFFTNDSPSKTVTNVFYFI